MALGWKPGPSRDFTGLLPPGPLGAFGRWPGLFPGSWWTPGSLGINDGADPTRRSAPTRRKRAKKRRSNDELRQLGRDPAEAMHLWKRLSAKEREAVLFAMREKFGDKFTETFQSYARKGQRWKMSYWLVDRNIEQVSAENLSARGYQLQEKWTDPLKYYHEIWTHPAGKLVWVTRAPEDSSAAKARTREHEAKNQEHPGLKRLREAVEVLERDYHTYNSALWNDLPFNPVPEDVCEELIDLHQAVREWVNFLKETDQDAEQQRDELEAANQAAFDALTSRLDKLLLKEPDLRADLATFSRSFQDRHPGMICQ